MLTKVDVVVTVVSDTDIEVLVGAARVDVTVTRLTIVVELHADVRKVVAVVVGVVVVEVVAVAVVVVKVVCAVVVVVTTGMETCDSTALVLSLLPHWQATLYSPLL